MAEALVNPKQSALATMAERLNIEPQKLHKTLKNTVFKNASDEEMLSLVVVANEHGLNPLTREIFAFPDKGGIKPMVSVDGWIKIMNQHPRFNGIRFNIQVDDKGGPLACDAFIYVKGREHPTVITEFYSECKRNTEPWNKYPFRMLRWKALSQGARVAFGFAGFGSDEETSEDVEPEIKTVLEGETEAPNAIELFGDSIPDGTDTNEVPEVAGEQVEANLE